MLSSLFVALLRLWNRVWRFRHGAGLVVRLVLLAARAGLLHPTWLNVRGTWYWTDLTETNSRRIIIEPGHDDALIGSLLNRVSVSGTVIDVGANIGVWTLAASRHVGPDGKVLAIEPNPDTAEVLRANLDRNETPNTTLLPVACVEAAGAAELFIDRSHSGLSSLSSRNGHADAVAQVTCKTLDAIVFALSLDRVDAVKIDVEGAEMRVLRGMTDTLDRFRPAVLLEISPDLLSAFDSTVNEIESFFQIRGYAQEAVDRNNALFTPNYGSSTASVG